MEGVTTFQRNKTPFGTQEFQRNNSIPIGIPKKNHVSNGVLNVWMSSYQWILYVFTSSCSRRVILQFSCSSSKPHRMSTKRISQQRQKQWIPELMKNNRKQRKKNTMLTREIREKTTWASSSTMQHISDGDIWLANLMYPCSQKISAGYRHKSFNNILKQQLYSWKKNKRKWSISTVRKKTSTYVYSMIVCCA